MMKAAPDLSTIALAAGEPFLLEVQIKTAAGAVPDMTGRSYALSFYRDDRSTVKAITGDLLTDAAALGGDPVFTLTRLPYDPASGSPAPHWSILPSLTDDVTPQVGEVIVGNDGTIVNGAATGRRFLLNGAPIAGATGASYTPIASDAGKALALEVTATGPGGTHSEVPTSILIAAATVQPPVITSPTAIASDGAPQVGEELTGIDPVVERVPLVAAIQRDPGMEAVYREYIADWQAATGDLMALYAATGPVSQYGAWGRREYAGQPIADIPKLRGGVLR